MCHSYIAWSQMSCTTLRTFHIKHCVIGTDVFFIVRHLKSINIEFITLRNRVKVFILNIQEKSQYYTKTSVFVQWTLSNFFFTLLIFLVVLDVDNIQVVDNSIQVFQQSSCPEREKPMVIFLFVPSSLVTDKKINKLNSNFPVLKADILFYIYYKKDIADILSIKSLVCRQ